MPIETNRLKLPLPLGNESVSRVGINAIFEKIDEGVATREDVEELRRLVSEMDIPDASVTQKGKVQLSNKIDGISESMAATEKAVGLAFQAGVEQKNNVVAALNSIGVTASTSETWAQLIPKISAIIRATGNAAATDLLTGKTASNASGPITGTMANRGAVSQSITTQNGSYTIPAGYHNGLGGIKAVFANLIAANVREGVNIGGVVGNLVEGSKYATGTVTSDLFSSTGVLYNGNSTTIGTLVTVSGLTFKPATIVIMPVTPQSYNQTTLYVVGNVLNGYETYQNNYAGFSIRVDGTYSYITQSGFKLAVNTGGISYRWHAYG